MLEWLQNPVIVLVLAIGAMFFGYFFGLFEGRGQGYKKRQAEEPDETKGTEQISEPLPPATPLAYPDEEPVLDVSRDRSGQLRLKLEDQRVDTSTLTPEQRKRIIAILTQLRPLLEMPTPASPPVRPQPVPPLSGDDLGTPPTTASRSSAKATSKQAKGSDEPVTAPQSIVEQVDSILQDQMVGTPLMEKGIRLMESPEGGVIVWVGMEKYEGVHEVPDEQIQAAIRAAINVWENKFTPGL